LRERSAETDAPRGSPSLVFLAIQVVALALVVVFPALATWLPGVIYAR
jgi:TRAP-type C4-dicarboxylate transport system permease large subunit